MPLVSNSSAFRVAPGAFVAFGPWLKFSQVTSPWNGAAGGDTATLKGSGFKAGAPLAVTFGGAAATNVAVVDSQTITCTTPAHATGAVDVTLTNGDGAKATLAGGYTYAWDPSLLSNLAWWARADRGVTLVSNAVSSWSPITGSESSRAATQSTAANRPTLSAAWKNNRPALALAESSVQRLVTPAFSVIAAQPATTWLVGQCTASAGSFIMAVDGLTSGNRNATYYNGTGAPNNPQTWAGAGLLANSTAVQNAFRQVSIFNGGTGKIILNGATLTTGNVGAEGLDGLTIGSQFDNTNPFNGFIGEIAIQKSVPTAQELTNMAAYINAFWGIA